MLAAFHPFADWHVCLKGCGHLVKFDEAIVVTTAGQLGGLAHETCPGEED